MTRLSGAWRNVDETTGNRKASANVFINSHILRDLVSERHWGRVYYGSELSVAGDQLQTVSQLSISHTEERRM